MTQESLKEKVSLLDELLKQKISQANSLKESMKPIEAFNAATKELCKKIEEIVKPKKVESLELISKEKISGEAYRYMTEVFESILSLTRSSKTDAEKLLFVKQQELNFLANEFTKLKEFQGKFVNELNKIELGEKEEKKEEQKPEYVRPDQNPNTKIGKAAMDIQQRKKITKGEE
jgi:hypothetical protein